GKDNLGSPSFLFLYGLQKHKANNSDTLEQNATFTHYVVFPGSKGHFPSFEAVKITHSYRSNVEDLKMYYKKDLYKYYTWRAHDKDTSLGSFKQLGSQGISLPYFESTYKDYYNAAASIKFYNFTPVENPNSLLNLSSGLSQYYDIIYSLYSNTSLYMRKKYLKQLMGLTPPKELYQFLAKTGSCELISGLFLELAKLSNPVLLNEAENTLVDSSNWAGESYMDGLKRCASIYIDSFKQREAKIEELQQTYHEMDLHLGFLNGEEIPEDKWLGAMAYRKYSLQGKFNDYYYEYNYEQRKSIKIKYPMRYKKSLYTDGFSLNIVNFKNTIQEAEIYDLRDVIGRVAYFLDAPRLVYYFIGRGEGKPLKYFRRQLKRLINSYFIEDSQKSMLAIKSLLLSYTENDYICKFNGNYQFNYFIKHYLFYSLNINSRRVNEFLNRNGRYEFMPEIWDKNFGFVVEIASMAKIDVISKAMYHILISPTNQEKLSALPLEKLIMLSDSKYGPVCELAGGLIIDKLRSENDYDVDIIFKLLKSNNPEIQNLAQAYFSKINLSPINLSRLIFMGDEYAGLALRGIEKLNASEYLGFLYAIIENAENSEFAPDIPNRVNILSDSQKQQLFSCLIKGLNSKNTLGLIENMIFLFPLDEIKSFLAGTEISQGAGSLLSSILLSVKNSQIPNDSIIIDILEKGTPNILKALVEIISQNPGQLKSRFASLLILMESDVHSLNELSKQAFDSLDNENKKRLHSIILDSPVEKVYGFAIAKLEEIYKNEHIPKEFLIQMIEHPSPDVKNFITEKINALISDLGGGDSPLFIYYAKSILFLPNRLSAGKSRVYEALPSFVKINPDKRGEIESMLLNIGGSNIILDSERALVALAKIRKEAV
ncbi:MAG: hypothetical protein LBV08_11325, partial [Clostridiales bacterium]|nr:hypothetical protein [Clostridiales bacterium]